MQTSWAGPGARDAARAVVVPFVLSRVLVIAALGLTREVVRDPSPHLLIRRCPTRTPGV